jgi:hemolysin III
MSKKTAIARPRYRGVSHQFGFFVVLGAAPTLLMFASGTRATVATVVYGLSLMGMLGASALLHRTHVSPPVEKWLERLDYSTIFLFIAGSYTPFCLLLQPPSSWTLLAVVWTGAVLGILRGVFWVDAPHWIAVVLYLIVGWAIVPFLGEVTAALGLTGIVLLGLGGVLYSVGAVVFALKKPNPWPNHFGYHEIFHAFVVVACVLHFVAVAQAVKRLAGS